MNQLVTIPRPGSIAPAAGLPASRPARSDRPHALALFRINAAAGIDRRVAARALRTSALPASLRAPSGQDSDGWLRIHFDADCLAAAEAAHGLRLETVPDISDRETYALAAMIFAHVSHHAEPEPLVLQSLGHVLLWRLMQLGTARPSCQPEPAPRGAPVRGGLAAWQVRRTTQHLAANTGRRVPLAELAAIARLSPFHFARAFTRTVGMPPHRYHLQLRMERACTLLARSDMRIIEIALAVGYETPQALARVFVQQHGITPSAWRRRHAQG